MKYFIKQLITIVIFLYAVSLFGERQNGFIAPLDNERNRLFDNDWLFFNGDIFDGEKLELDDNAWRKLHLPHDWSIEDLPFKEFVADYSIATGTWLFAEGDDMSRKEKEYDDHLWQQVKIPDRWNNHSNYQGEYNWGWYRKYITIPDSLVGKVFDLNLGCIDDVDEVYLNGKMIGSTGIMPDKSQKPLSAYNSPRYYRVTPDMLSSRGNVIAVRVYNILGGGGMWSTGKSKVPDVGPFSVESPGGINTGYTIGGTGWYRKHFKLSPSDSKKQFIINFDGVYMNSDVWINGKHIGFHPYGYTNFSYDLTPYLFFDGRKNLIAVRVRNEGSNSRWYTGSGIYRHVWLVAKDKVSIKENSVYIKTGNLSTDEAKVYLEAVVENRLETSHKVNCIVEIYSPENKLIYQQKNNLVDVSSHGEKLFKTEFIVKKPQTWNVDAPNLYKAVIKTISSGNSDRESLSFGIRTIGYSPDKGFLLNGKSIKLRGGCIHHDHGIIGSAAYDRAEIRKIELLKQRGFNAVRISHHPPSIQLLNACDRLGMLVLDEAFDTWTYTKSPLDYGVYFKEWWERDIESMVLLARNHPSVVIWSIGNEIEERATPEGTSIARKLKDKIKSLDNTRPVTQAVPSFWTDTTKTWDDTSPAFSTSDIHGYNYQFGEYESDHKKHPSRIMLGTESYPNKMFDIWQLTEKHPYIIGDFVWTAMDHLGETAVGHAVLDNEKTGQNLEWPWINANCGDLDINGIQKAQSFYRDILWGIKNLSIAVHAPIPEGRKEIVSRWGWENEYPSWSWAGTEGKRLQVNVYSRYPTIELYLNDEIIGTQNISERERYTTSFSIPYRKGVLTAYGLNAKGERVDKFSLATSQGQTQIKMIPDRNIITNNPNDLSFIQVMLMDKNNNLFTDRVEDIYFEISGPAKLLGVGNAAPNQPASYQQDHSTTYRGRCMVVIQPLSQGEVCLKAKTHSGSFSEVKILIK